MEKDLTIRKLQECIKNIDHKNNMNDKYMLKLMTSYSMYLNKKYNKEVDCADRSNFQEFNYQRENAKNKLKIWHYKNI